MRRPLIRDWICLSRIILPAALAAFPAFAIAQEVPRVPAAAPRTIVLPRETVAGATATLAVLDSSGRLLPHVVVEILGGQKVTTDSTGRASFVVPGEAGVLTARISGRDVSASAPITKMSDPAPATSVEDLSPALRVLDVPHFISLHDRFTLGGGGFRGEAADNRVFLSDRECLVLASSPVSLVILPGLHIPIGTINLRVTAGGHEAGPKPVVMVLLELGGPTEAPPAGAQGKLTVRAHGTRERLAIEVRNSSPEIIQFVRGNVERVTTSGGEPNAAEIETKFLASGDYTVTARLIPTDSGLPDLEAARQKLVAARALRRIERAPQDIAEIRAELQEMLDEKPSGEFAFLIESAWQEFQKE